MALPSDAFDRADPVGDSSAQDPAERERRELADFFDNAPIAMHWVGPDGVILRVNQAELDLLGYRRDEYVGHHIAEFHVDRDVIGSILDRLAAGHDARDCEARMRTRVGTIKHVLVNSSGLWGDGRFVHSRCVTLDITRQRLVEASLREGEQRFVRFMQHLPGLAWIKDLRGRYVYANDAALGAFRVSRARLYGRTDDELFPSHTAAQFQENDRRALANPTGVQVIETLEHDDGLVHHSIVSKFPILDPDNRPAWVGGMAIDVTERMQAEQALREADQRKDRFLALLGHELRNPLAGILNGVQVLKLVGAQSADAAEMHDVIERQATQMARLIDDLLDLSRISEGKISLRTHRVDLVEVARLAAEDHRPVFAAATLAIHVEAQGGPLWVDGDPVRLAQILGNLLHNAVKFSNPGGAVRVSVRRDTDDAVLAVQDAGIGMSPETLATAFQPFSQADEAAERNRGGLGLGLALVKGLVELHRGTVEAKSPGIGRGSTFTIRLPLARRDRPEGGNQHAVVASKAARVLVIDDSRDACLSLSRLLELSGHVVAVALDGPRGVERAHAFRPDVVLCDINLQSEMSGYAVAQTLRRDPRLKSAFLVAITGYGQDEDRRRAIAAGFDRHLTKPVGYEALQSLLASLLGEVSAPR